MYHTLVIQTVYLKGIYPFVVNCDIIVVITSWIRKSGRQITGGFNSDLFTLSINLDLYIHGWRLMHFHFYDTNVKDNL